jgi:hypothetical protein
VEVLTRFICPDNICLYVLMVAVQSMASYKIGNHGKTLLTLQGKRHNFTATRHAGGKERDSSYSFLTSAFDGGEW